MTDDLSEFETPTGINFRMEQREERVKIKTAGYSYSNRGYFKYEDKNFRVLVVELVYVSKTETVDEERVPNRTDRRLLKWLQKRERHWLKIYNKGFLT